jgi:hypothetical protein
MSLTARLSWDPVDCCQCGGEAHPISRPQLGYPTTYGCGDCQHTFDLDTTDPDEKE